MVADVDSNFKARRDENIRPRAELDQSKTLATLDLITDLWPADYPPRHNTGNLCTPYSLTFAVYHERVPFIYVACLISRCRKFAALFVDHFADGS